MTVFIGLGSNLGDRLELLRRAARELGTRSIAITARSGIYETTPVDMDSDRPFLNAAIAVRTGLSPRALLRTLLAIERGLGRERTGVSRDRTCDLDLLLYDDRRVRDHGLVLPHPRIRLRRFVLLPLLDIEPDLRDPVSGKAYREDAERLARDPSQRCELAVPSTGW